MNEGVIQPAHLMGNDPEGPFIANNMVHGHQTRMLLFPETYQLYPKQGALPQIKGCAEFLRNQRSSLFFPLCFRQEAQIYLLNPEAAVRIYLLHRHSVAFREAGPQDLVPS